MRSVKGRIRMSSRCIMTSRSSASLETALSSG